MSFPLVAVLPKDHGRHVPPSFLRQCEETVRVFRSHLAGGPNHTVDPDQAAQIIESFTWFMADSREWAQQLGSKDELIKKFLAWRTRNIRGGPLEVEVVPALETYFKFMEERRLVATGGGLGNEQYRADHQGDG